MPRFVLQRRQPRIRERAITVTIAAALTATLAAVSGTGTPRLLRVVETRGEVTRVLAVERLYFMVVPPDDTRVAVPAIAMSRSRAPGSRIPTSALVVIPEAAAEQPAETSAAARASDADPYVPWMAPSRSYAPGVVTAPRLDRFPGTKAITAEQRDSVLRRLEHSVPYAPRVPPTLAQRDSMMRDEWRRWADAREQGRPVAVGAVWELFMPGADKKKPESSPAARGASGGFGLPLFSSGPTTGERRRDKAIHADNVRRLQRMAERARARVDSIRRMDSIAMLTRP